MALYEGVKRIEGSRSNTYLTKSGHGAPATDWILSPDFLKKELKSVFDEGVLFEYQYGGPGLTDVTIPKGRFVGVGKSIKDRESGVCKTTVTLPGLSLENNVVGVVPYNVTKDWLQFDYFGGNKPCAITQDLIVLPLLSGVEPETSYDITGVKNEEQKISKDLKMPWGAVIGKGIHEGCFLKATPSGRACKWDKTKDKPYEIVGKVLEMDLNQESWGWEKWMLWDESVRKEEDNEMNRFNKSGVSGLPSDINNFPYDGTYDPAYYEGFRQNIQSYQSLYTENPTGIPGLHDGSGNYAGFGRNDQEFKDVVLGKTPATINEEKIVYSIRALDAAGQAAKNIVAEGLKVSIDGTEIDAKNFTVDEEEGIINITVEKAQAGKEIKATYKMKFYGTPSYLDFKGVVGSVSVLLTL